MPQVLDEHVVRIRAEITDFESNMRRAVDSQHRLAQAVNEASAAMAREAASMTSRARELSAVADAAEHVSSAERASATAASAAASGQAALSGELNRTAANAANTAAGITAAGVATTRTGSFVAFATSAFSRLIDVFERVIRTVGGLVSGFLAYHATLQTIPKAMDGTAFSALNMGDKMQRVGRQVKATSDGLLAYVRSWRDLNKAMAGKGLGDIAGAAGEAGAAIGAADDELENMGRTAGRTRGMFTGLVTSVLGIASAFIAWRTAMRVVRFVFNINREMQDLQANLQTVTGSAAHARAAFGDIVEFARETPFGIRQLTDAFVRLQAFGAGPTIEQFRGLGNISAAFSRDITDMTDAIVSAVNTSIEPIRRFGVQARVTGDSMAVTFGGVTRTIPRTTKALTDFLAEMGNTGVYAGAMERRMLTLGGATSNLSDTMTVLALRMGSRGLNRELVATIRELDRASAEGMQFADIMGDLAAGGVAAFRSALMRAIPLLQQWAVLLEQFRDPAEIIAAPWLERIGRTVNLDHLGRELNARTKEVGVLERGLESARADLEALGEAPQPREGWKGFMFGDPTEPVDVDARRKAAEERLREAEGHLRANEMARLAIVQQIRDIEGGIAPQPPALLDGGDAEKDADQFKAAMEALAAGRREIAAMAEAVKGTSVEFNVAEETARLLETTFRSLAALPEKYAERVKRAMPEVIAEWKKELAVLDAIKRTERAREQAEARRQVHREFTERHQAAVRGFEAAMAATETERVQKEMEEIQGAVADGVRAVADGFLAIIAGTEDVGDAFRKMALDIIASIQRILVERAIIEPLLAMIFGGSGQFVGGVDLGALGLPHFARGGPIRRGQPAIVGERGPELFVPASAGRIIPEVPTIGNKDPVVVQIQQTYEVRALDTRDASTFIRQMQPEIAAAAARGLRQAPGLRGMVRR